MVQHSKNQYSPSHQQTREEKSQIIALDTDKVLVNQYSIQIHDKNSHQKQEQRGTSSV